MKKIIILLSIFTLALILRFHSFSESPKSLYWDEVSIGYNAFSISQTGKDEWGKSYPWFFEAFNEYKFPVPIYITALSIKLFGLSEFAVRLPSVLLGSLSAIAIYFFSILMSDVLFRKNKFLIYYKKKVAILSSFIISISPWGIQFSRGMFEANLALFFEICSLIFFLKFIKSQKLLNLFPFILFLFLSCYSYGVQILLLPLLSVILIINTKYKTVKKMRLIFIFAFTFCLIEIPFLSHLQQDGYTRFNQVSMFSQNPILEKVINLRTEKGEFSKIIFNRYSAASINYANNLLKHLNPFFLYPGRDGNPRHMSSGLIFAPELLLILLSVLLMNRDKKSLFICLILIIINFTPVSLTNEAPHALRSLNSLPFIIILISSGMTFLISLFRKRKQYIFAIIIITYFFSVNQYLINYYKIYNVKSSSSWGIENKYMSIDAGSHAKQDRNVYITGDFWRPYIYYYFYNRIEPSFVIKNNNSTRIGNVWFGYAKWDKEDRRYDLNFKPESLILTKKKTVLYLSASENQSFRRILKKNSFVAKDIWKNSDGNDAIYLYEN